MLDQGSANLLEIMPIPDQKRLARYKRIANAELRNNAKLIECDPITICQAISKIIGWGLEIGNETGEAYLIPRWNKNTNKMECQAQRGYKGLVRQVRNSGQVVTFYAQAVHKFDNFRVRYGSNPELFHEPAFESDEMTHVYAVCSLKDGGCQFDVMTTGQVEAHRDQYSKQKDGDAWRNSFEEMAKKTIIRRLIKMLPIAISSEDDTDDFVSFGDQQPAQRHNPVKYQQLASASDIVPEEERSLYLRQIEGYLAEAAKGGVDLRGTHPDNYQTLPVPQLVAICAILKEKLA